MKNFIAIALVIVLAVSLLTSCDFISKVADNINKNDKGSPTDLNNDGNNDDVKNNDDKNDNDEDGLKYDKNYINSNLKGDFSITYTANEESGGWAQTIMRTSEGCYSETTYSDSDGGTGAMKILYLKNGDVFDVYTDWSGEGFGTSNMTMTENEVMESFPYFYMFDNVRELYDNVKKDGTETIAGRNCDIYKVTVSADGQSASFYYSVDRQTGIFMKSVMGPAIMECTEFKTSGVSLPSYS